MMIESEKRWISLCRVNAPDKNDFIWMQRLADIDRGMLVSPPEVDENADPIFENRRLIFCQDGPQVPDSVGFWEWTDRQREDGSGRWQSEAFFVEDQVPIELITVNNTKNAEDIVSALKAGICIPNYIQNNILFVGQTDDDKQGVFCNLSDFNIYNGDNMNITLKKDIYSLPCYKLMHNDIFTWKYRQFYNCVSLQEPTGKVQVYIPFDSIRQAVLSRMNWPIFKAQGIKKADWQKFKAFIKSIPSASIYEEISVAYEMAIDEATWCVHEFIRSIDSYIGVEDIDANMFAQIIKNHDTLREYGENIAVTQWRKDHQAEIAAAEAEVEIIKQRAKAEAQAAQNHLQEIEQRKVSVEKDKTALLAEIASAQAKLDGLICKINQYEALGNDALQAVRDKIADAQKDMAGFIAGLSVFMPQAEQKTNILKGTSWNYTSDIMQSGESSLEKDEIEVCKTWKDELDLLHQNLHAMFSVNNELCIMLSSFLYAAYVNKVPLLIAGPCGREFADSLSVSISGRVAGLLELGNQWDADIVESTNSYPDLVMAIENLFCKGWSDTLPQAFLRSNKAIIWAHPYTEDLAVEPMGLYNYALPLFSECFVEASPTHSHWPGIRAEKFQLYRSKQKQSMRVSTIKKLGLSKLSLNRLQTVLSDAKTMLGNESKDKDLEVLFALLPLAVLTGKTDLLRDTIDNEKGISKSVKEEIMRYIKEE